MTNDQQEIEKIIARGNYDVVSVIDTPHVHALLRKVAKHQKVIMEVHTPFPPMRKYIKTDIVEDAFAVIVPTATFGRLVESEMKKPHPPIVPVPNPVNRLFFAEKGDIPKQTRVPVAYVGRIEQIKDWKESVRVVQHVVKRNKGTDFFMVGRLIDEKPEDLFRAISKAGLADHVRWIPFIEPDPGLRIPVEKQNLDRFAQEGRLLNPRKSALRDQVAKALADFPGGEDTKLLFLVCDGADTGGNSFCERPLNLAKPAGLRFYAISLNVEDPVQREELDCLSRQMDGESIHLSPRDPVVSTVLPIAQKAYQDEVERQLRVAEEHRRIEALLSKTRLKVEFLNTLDPFCARLPRNGCSGRTPRR